MTDKPIVYAIGDIHGQADALRDLSALILDHVAARTDGRESMFVFLGDYIDRGPDSKGVIDFIRSDPFPGETICLKGNHEDMWLDAIFGTGFDLWYSNGGMATDNSFGGHVPDEYVQWAKNLKIYYIIEQYLFVHAGINPARSIREQSDAEMMWIRNKFLMTREMFEYRVVHGHTPVIYDPLGAVMQEDKDNPDKPLIIFPNRAEEKDTGPVILPNRINLDTGAGYGAKLSCGVIDTETDHVEILSVSVQPHGFKVTDTRVMRDVQAE